MSGFEGEPGGGRRARLIYVTVFVIATCGLVYELVAGTLASYVLGDSVTQFSTVIGVYLSALGLGAWLSRFVQRQVARRFVEIELGVALLGGASAPLLFLAFGFAPDLFRPALYLVVSAVGTLVGLEIPLILRILRSSVEFKELVAQVLTVDYIGALCASLLFPLVLVPELGLVRTSLLLGIANAAVGLWSTWLLPRLERPLGLRVRGVLVLILLAVAFTQAGRLTRLAEAQIFADEIVYARTTPYQRIVMTRSGDDFQLFLNGNLQFSSTDEYRYHEALVHPLMAAAARHGRVLVLGGGDGLAVRELLKYPSVREVVLVDLDPEMTRLARDNPLLARLNRRALHDERVRVVNADAFTWLAEDRSLFDAAVLDFPDPNSFSLGKLYTRHFYRQLKARLDPEAVIAVQSTSPLVARRSYWCIHETLKASGFVVHPYHVAVPAFGEWGFALASPSAFEAPEAPAAAVAGELRSLDAASMASLFVMGPDLAPLEVEVNRLNDQVLVHYYEREWREWP